MAGLYLAAYQPIADRYGATTIGAYASLPDIGKRYFYKRTDLALKGRKRFGVMRMPIRYAELIVGLARSLLLIARRRPKAVFYALSSNLAAELLFVLILRLFRVQIYVICHDVVPFVSAYESRRFKDIQRRQFYRFADKLICHNKRSLAELNERYGIAESKLEYIPFPLMDMRTIKPLGGASNARKTSRTGTNFLFIGHMRAEKGVDLLIDAWRSGQPLPDARLTIAGQVPGGEKIQSVAGIPALNLEDRYIDEPTYVRLIAEADCVVLPYISGTNSGVLSTVVSLGKPAIVSDIAMFRESGLVDSDSYFRAGDASALRDKIVEYAGLPNAERSAKIAGVERLRSARIADFSTALTALLDRIADSPSRA